MRVPPIKLPAHDYVDHRIAKSDELRDVTCGRAPDAPRHTIGMSRMTYDPNDWQALLPDYFPAVRHASDEVFRVLSGIKGDMNDSMLEAAVARWCVARIEAWVDADLESGLNFRMSTTTRPTERRTVARLRRGP